MNNKNRMRYKNKLNKFFLYFSEMSIILSVLSICALGKVYNMPLYENDLQFYAFDLLK